MSKGFIFVDIGALQTKVIYVTVSGTRVVVQKQCLITNKVTISSSTENAKIIRETVKQIRVALDKMGVTEKRVVLLSSILDISTMLLDYPAKTEQDVARVFMQDVNGKRYPTNTKVRDYQVYGKFMTETDINMTTLVSTADTEYLLAIADMFKANKLNLTAVMSETSAVLNLMKLDNLTYDDNSRIYVELGSNTVLYLISKGVPRLIDKLPTTLEPVISTLAEHFNVGIGVMLRAIKTVGLVQNDKNIEKLKQLGIADVDIYYSTMTKQFKEFFMALDQKLHKLFDDFFLDDSDVYVLGGFISTPGVSKVMTIPMNLLELDDFLVSKDVSVVNETGHALTSAFMALIGASLRCAIKKPINLLPFEKMARVVDNYVLYGLRGCIALTSAVLCLNSTLISASVMKSRNVSSLSESVKAQQVEIDQLTSELSKLDDYILISETTSNYLAQLVKFMNNYNNGVISVVSIDSKSLLPEYNMVAESEAIVNGGTSAEVKPQSEDIKSEDKKETTKATDESNTPETQVDASDKTGLKDLVSAKKDVYILRGYSQNSAISQMYMDLKKFEFVKNAQVNMIQRKILPTLEVVYVFEITLELE